jgi:hypothetical protein
MFDIKTSALKSRETILVPGERRELGQALSQKVHIADLPGAGRGSQKFLADSWVHGSAHLVESKC